MSRDAGCLSHSPLGGLPEGVKEWGSRGGGGKGKFSSGGRRGGGS